ncbi:MAG: FAD-binding dehydrogenase [Rhodocyclaceae bacterium]|nr:FAD-binding dehydrogenase [Rhodocyclaceae bacterium]
MERHECDVAIVGGGLAGIVAALELLERNLRVLILDRDAEENFGGLARESFGGIFVVDSPEQKRARVADSPERALADWRRFGELDAADPTHALPLAWATAYVGGCRSEVYDWLKGQGIGFLPIPHWVERDGNSVPRFHIVWGTGRELALVLIRRLREHRNAGRLTRLFGRRVEGLTRQDGRVAGCVGRGEAGGAAFEVAAGAVLVAAGGINGDLRRVARHWHPQWRRPPPTLLNGSHRYADGLMHDAVEAAGGSLSHLDWMWDYAAGIPHWAPRKPDHGLSLVPCRSALWLDWQGRRFEPPLITGFDTRDLVTRICATERQYSWQVLNRRIALKELAVSGAEFNRSIRDKKRLGFLRDILFGNRWLVDTLLGNSKEIVTAATLPELVAKMNGLQGDAAVQLPLVEAAVSAWDRAIAAGPPYADAQLQRIELLRQWKGDRIRTCNFQKIADPGAGPLIAIREHIVSRKSLGGIRNDLDGRVLDAAGRPIAGLFAAGEAAGFGGGGMNGLRALEGTFLGGCVFSARRAAKAIAG